MGRIDCFSPMVITPINFFSHDLWQWLAAAFPDAKYCLASATLTDAAVRDMQGVLVSLVLQFMLFHLTNSSFTAHQAKEMKILFRGSSRPNIYLQVQLQQFSELQPALLHISFVITTCPRTTTTMASSLFSSPSLLTSPELALRSSSEGKIPSTLQVRTMTHTGILL